MPLPESLSLEKIKKTETIQEILPEIKDFALIGKIYIVLFWHNQKKISIQPIEIARLLRMPENLRAVGSNLSRLCNKYGYLTKISKGEYECIASLFPNNLPDTWWKSRKKPKKKSNFDDSRENNRGTKRSHSENSKEENESSEEQDTEQNEPTNKLRNYAQFWETKNTPKHLANEKMLLQIEKAQTIICSIKNIKIQYLLAIQFCEKINYTPYTDLLVTLLEKGKAGDAESSLNDYQKVKKYEKKKWNVNELDSQEEKIYQANLMDIVKELAELENPADVQIIREDMQPG